MKEKTKIKTNEKLLLVLFFICHSSIYFGRFSYSSNINAIIETFHVTHAESGLVTSMFFFAYGIFTIVNAFLVRKYSKRYTVPAVLFISALMNLIIFLGIDFKYYKYLWFINGVSQSFIYVTLSETMSSHLSKETLNSCGIIMSVTTPLGQLLSYGLSSLFNFFNNYMLSFLFGFIIPLFSAILWLIGYGRLKKTFTVNWNEENENKKEMNEKRKTIAKYFLIQIIILFIYGMCTNFIRDGLSTWAPTIFKEKYNLSNGISLLLTLGLPLISILTSFTISLLHNYINDFVNICSVFILLALLGIALMLVFLNSSLWIIAVILFMIISFQTNNVATTSVTWYPLYMRKYVSTGFLTGILNGACYIGTVISSYGLGAIADKYGWNAMFMIFIVLISLLSTGGVIYYFINKKYIVKHPEYILEK